LITHEVYKLTPLPRAATVKESANEPPAAVEAGDALRKRRAESKE